MKRLFDLAFIIFLAPFWVPLFAFLALLVALRLGRPVFFRQKRIGLHNQPFHLLKFRSMEDKRDPAGNLLPDMERTPAFGRWLRSTSLDELPELWNVLKGDMSLVGPRPLLPHYLPWYSPEQAERHQVRPGLTGLAQVRGRNALDWDERLAYDTEYARAQSLVLDLKLLGETIPAVLFRRGINQSADQTSQDFTDYCRSRNRSPNPTS
jgi:sugar transferase EpsL